MKKMILVDPHVSGHHLSYIRLYAGAFAEMGCEVAVLTPDPQLLKSYLRGLMAEHQENIKVYELPRRHISTFESTVRRKHGIKSDFWKSYYTWLDFRDIARAVKNNGLCDNALIFILWLDTYMARYLPPHFIDAVLPTRFAGIYFHPAHIKKDEQTNKVYRDLLFHLPLLNCNKLERVFCLDKIMANKLSLRYKNTRFQVIPDVAEKHVPDTGNELIKEILKRARNRKIVSLVGSLDPRKNVLNFLRAARECSSEDVFFVCAGKLHAERFSSDDLKTIKEIAINHSDMVYLYDDFVSADEIFDALFVISSAIFAVYVNFASSSNMLVKASLYGVPVLVCGDHLMGELVAEYDLGLSIEKADPWIINEAIRQLLQNEHAYGFDRFNNDYSYGRFKSALASVIA